MIYTLKNLFKKKPEKEALQKALEAGYITQEEKFRLEADRADKNLTEFLGKKKGK